MNFKEYEYGWLEPSGIFHDVDFGDHEKFAANWMRDKDNLGELDENYFWWPTPADAFVANGWILIHNPHYGIGKLTINHKHLLTQQQRKFLAAYYDKYEEPVVAEAIEKNYLLNIPNFIDFVEIERLYNPGK